MQGRQQPLQEQGEQPASSKKPRTVRTTDDEIREKYLERAIRELNSLSREVQGCPHCPRGNLMPVLGSGHPQADVMLLKYRPMPAEIEEGVAFYGRSGSALMKSLKRLSIDPLATARWRSSAPSATRPWRTRAASPASPRRSPSSSRG